MLTNAGENVNLPVSEARQLLGLAGSATVNAYNEIGATREIKIQAAINRAVSIGADRVFVPTSMLPYDAASVTFNNDVQMVREGGSFDVYDVDAYGAYGDDVTDDSASFQAAFDGMPTVGGLVTMGPKTYRAMNVAPPVLTSYEIQGAGPTATIVRPPAATPSNPVFDLTGSNGPSKIFRAFKIAGANEGLFESTGIYLETTNGTLLRDMWFAGCLTGISWNTPCSFLDVAGTVIESCGIGVNFTSSPIECLMRGMTYFSNAQDLQVTGDCTTFRHTNSTSMSCSNTAVAVLTATNFSMSDFVIYQAVLGIQVTSSPESSFSDGLLSGCTTDFANSGTLRIYSRDVRAVHTPFYGAGIYLGTFNGGKRFMLSRGVPTSLDWNAGDYAKEEAPAVGSAKGWYCTVGGTPGTWVSEGNL